MNAPRSGTRRRAPAITPEPSNVDIATDTRTVAPRTLNGHQLVPTAYAVAFPPCGRRRRWITVVTDCPLCIGGDHVHRGFEDAPSKGIRRSGCSGRLYWVVITGEAGQASAVVA